VKMGDSNFREVVFTGPSSSLAHVQKILASAGIRCRSSSPKRAEGLVRVPQANGERARACIRSSPPQHGRVIEATEAAWLRCPNCQAMLSLGARTCAACGEDVADPHGS